MNESAKVSGPDAVLQDMTNTPKDRAVSAARSHASNGHDPRTAAQMALADVPACKLTRDQLRAAAFGAVLYGFGTPLDE